jgi:hypothetical protein
MVEGRKWPENHMKNSTGISKWMLHRTLFWVFFPSDNAVLQDNRWHTEICFFYSHDLYPPGIRIMYTPLQCWARNLQVVLGYTASRKAFQELSPSVSYTEKTVCIQDLVFNHLHSSSGDFYWWKSRHTDTSTSWRKQQDDWTPGVHGERPEINL